MMTAGGMGDALTAGVIFRGRRFMLQITGTVTILLHAAVHSGELYIRYRCHRSAAEVPVLYAEEGNRWLWQ